MSRCSGPLGPPKSGARSSRGKVVSASFRASSDLRFRYPSALPADAGPVDSGDNGKTCAPAAPGKVRATSTQDKTADKANDGGARSTPPRSHASGLSRSAHVDFSVIRNGTNRTSTNCHAAGSQGPIRTMRLQRRAASEPDQIRPRELSRKPWERIDSRRRPHDEDATGLVTDRDPGPHMRLPRAWSHGQPNSYLVQ